jgi:hypothetical protein
MFQGIIFSCYTCYNETVSTVDVCSENLLSSFGGMDFKMFSSTFENRNANLVDKNANSVEIPLPS